MYVHKRQKIERETRQVAVMYAEMLAVFVTVQWGNACFHMLLTFDSKHVLTQNTQKLKLKLYTMLNSNNFKQNRNIW